MNPTLTQSTFVGDVRPSRHAKRRLSVYDPLDGTDIIARKLPYFNGRTVTVTITLGKRKAAK